MKKTLLVTGASGQMGREVLAKCMESEMLKGIVLLRKKKENVKLAKKLAKKYGENIEIIFGDLSNTDDCAKCVEKADYVFHCAAIIPPASDHNPTLTYSSNYLGTVNICDAVCQSPRRDEIKFIEIGSVAEYGNRNYKHPWGRVGDPLIAAAYDFYAATKIRAERYVIESGLKYWVSLRQSGMLYDQLMMNNMEDGLMFHTCWNTPIEWATARSSGVMARNLIVGDINGSLPESFWRKVYNIGNGENARVTGYQVFESGFGLMGCTPKDIFKPNWNISRNFHCMWYYDSDVLENYLHFQQSETYQDFWKHMAKKNWYFILGKPFKSLIRKLAIERLFKNSNSPKYWLEHNLEGRINAFFGGREEYNKIPESWENYPLLCEGKTPDGEVDYQQLKKKENVTKDMLLSHGYDETKPDSELDIEDMIQAAKFRGGKCLSQTMEKGDLYTKLKWACHDGHEFYASPYLILKSGHWCPECCQPGEWNYDQLAKKIPFYAQIWYDSHSPDENNRYPADCYKDISSK